MTNSESATGTARPRVIFINRYFYPDHSATSQMLSQLAFSLPSETFEIIVITSRQRYEDAAAALSPFESINGVGIHRVWSSAFGRAGIAGRAIDYVTFYLSSARQLSRLIKPGDIVVAKTDPPLLSVFLYRLIRSRQAMLVNWIQDLFPEVAGALNLGSWAARPLYAMLTEFRNRALTSASANVVLGTRMAERITGAGVAPSAIHIIPNWADGSLVRPIEPGQNALRRDWGLESQFVVAYSGNLGRAHEHETMLDVMTLISDWSRPERPDPDLAGKIRFLFVGGGATMDRLKSGVQSRGLTNVLFKPYQPVEKLSESLSAGDVHFVSLRPELEGCIVPSKVYGIAAAGRSILFIGDKRGEISKLIEQERCGASFAPGDAHAIANYLLDLARNPDLARWHGEASRALFERRFTREIASQSWTRLLTNLSNSRRA